MAATQVVNFGIGDRHLKYSENNALDEDGLKNFIQDEINKYTLIALAPGQIQIVVTPQGAYGTLEGANTSPSEPFLDYNESASRQTGEYWVDTNNSGTWVKSFTGSYGIFTGRAVVTPVEITIDWTWFLSLGGIPNGEIYVRIPVANVLSY